MYLAKKWVRGELHYVIRQSVPVGRRMESKEIIDMGRDPSRHIIYPGGNAFYIDPEFCDQLKELGVEPDNDELEKVFWPFLDPETRRVIEIFTRPSTKRGETIREHKKRCETEAFHLFDQKRMHYLRYGEIDQSRINVVPKKIYRGLLDKSRDEIEQQFLEMERVLKHREKKNYVYTIFDVAGHFRSEIARKFPQALDQDKVDAIFLKELCRINADAGFWADAGVSDGLNTYLIRYACWFFDSDFEGSTYLEDLMWQFKRRHHGFALRSPRPPMPTDEAVSLMGITLRDLDAMTLKDLTRQYRVMARTYHPDKGGDHENFIRLNRAFKDLLKQIKGEAGKTRYTTRRG
jgi:hypothetical protein